MNKPNCYECIHHRTIPGNAHIECVHPAINPRDRFITPLLMVNGNQSAPAMKRLNVMAFATGIRRGWFSWPINFDPTWLLTCDGWEGKVVSTHETTAAK